MMKICVNVPTVNLDGGGVSTAVLSLYNNYVRRVPGSYVTFKTMTNGSQDSLEDNATLKSFMTIGPRRLGFSPSLIISSFFDVSDIMHQHGIWMANTLYNNLYSLAQGRPYIISPHGMMDPWILSRGKLKKSVVRFLYENRSWASSSAFHALNSQEADAIRKIIPSKKIYVIPNGIDAEDYTSDARFSSVFNITYLGRIHEKKNILNLIKAVLCISESTYIRKPFVLNIAGWGDDNLVSKIQELILLCPGRFNFIGPVFGEEKRKLLLMTDLFVLPSFSEGLPMAVLESWSLGAPVLMSRNCNLSEAFELNAAVECSVDYDSLLLTLENILCNYSNNDLKKLAENGHRYVKENYSWGKVSSLYYDMYKDSLR